MKNHKNKFIQALWSVIEAYY